MTETASRTGKYLKTGGFTMQTATAELNLGTLPKVNPYSRINDGRPFAQGTDASDILNAFHGITYGAGKTFKVWANFKAAVVELHPNLKTAASQMSTLELANTLISGTPSIDEGTVVYRSAVKATAKVERAKRAYEKHEEQKAVIGPHIEATVTRIVPAVVGATVDAKLAAMGATSALIGKMSRMVNDYDQRFAGWDAPKA